MKNITQQRDKNLKVKNYISKLHKILKRKQNPKIRIIRDIYTQLVYENMPESYDNRDTFKLIVTANRLIYQSMNKRIEELESQLEEFDDQFENMSEEDYLKLKEELS